MIASLMALSLHLVAAPAAPVDVFGATVPVQDVDVLLVAPADRDALREHLALVRDHRVAKAGGAAPKPLVVAIDISDVSALFRGKAKDKIKARATEATKQQTEGAPPVRFVADQDGSVGRAFRGPHKGTCLVTISPQGEYVSGITVAELAKTAKAPRP